MVGSSDIMFGFLRHFYGLISNCIVCIFFYSYLFFLTISRGCQKTREYCTVMYFYQIVIFAAAGVQYMSESKSGWHEYKYVKTNDIKNVDRNYWSR